MTKIRIHQFLSKTGAFDSKKELISAVKRGEIKVNDKVITNLHYQFNPRKNKVYYKGKLLEVVNKKVYLLVNKPVGYLSSKLTNNEKDKKSIFKSGRKKRFCFENAKNFPPKTRGF